MAGVKDKLITAESLKYVNDKLEDQMGEIVEISDTEPQSDFNEIWIDPTDEEIEIPDMGDLNAVDAKVDNLKNDFAGQNKINFAETNDYTGVVNFPLEIGYIRVSSGQLSFRDNNSNMRTPEGFPVALKAGDVFTLSNNAYRFQFLYYSGGEWKTTGWKTAAYTSTFTGNVYIVVGTADDSTITNAAELVNSVTVTRPINGSYLNRIQLLGEFRNTVLKENEVAYTLESGYIAVSSGQITFSQSKTALRCPISKPVTLSPRDTISVINGYRYQFIYPNDSTGLWTGTGWKTVDWQMPASVFRTGYLVVAHSNGAEIDLSETEIFRAVEIKHTVYKAPFTFDEKMLDVSHRGYQYIAPQSTRAAYSLAKKYGYNGIECDIRLTSDNQMVIHHNEGMPSDSTYKIAEHTLAELRANANMGTYNGEVQEILTFDDLLILTKNLGLNLFIEMKAELTDEQKTAVVTSIKSMGMSKQCFIMCNVNDATYIYRHVDEEIGLLLLYSQVDTYIRGLVNGKGYTSIYANSVNLTAQAIKDCHDAGVHACGYCVSFNSESAAKAEIIRCVEAGIDGMGIDRWTLANVVSEYYGIA